MRQNITNSFPLRSYNINNGHSTNYSDFSRNLNQKIFSVERNLNDLKLDTETETSKVVSDPSYILEGLKKQMNEISQNIMETDKRVKLYSLKNLENQRRLREKSFSNYTMPFQFHDYYTQSEIKYIQQDKYLKYKTPSRSNKSNIRNNNEINTNMTNRQTYNVNNNINNKYFTTYDFNINHIDNDINNYNIKNSYNNYDTYSQKNYSYYNNDLNNINISSNDKRIQKGYIKVNTSASASMNNKNEKSLNKSLNTKVHEIKNELNPLKNKMNKLSIDINTLKEENQKLIKENNEYKTQNKIINESFN